MKKSAYGWPLAEEFAVAEDQGLGVRQMRDRFQQGLVGFFGLGRALIRGVEYLPIGDKVKTFTADKHGWAQILGWRGRGLPSL